jgi:hypothetical protein
LIHQTKRSGMSGSLVFKRQPLPGQNCRVDLPADVLTGGVYREQKPFDWQYILQQVGPSRR